MLFCGCSQPATTRSYPASDQPGQEPGPPLGTAPCGPQSWFSLQHQKVPCVRTSRTPGTHRNTLTTPASAGVTAPHCHHGNWTEELPEDTLLLSAEKKITTCEPKITGLPPTTLSLGNRHTILLWANVKTSPCLSFFTDKLGVGGGIINISELPSPSLKSCDSVVHQ